MRVQFDETLLTGNSTIDEQHRELIDRINKVLILCENEKPAKREAINLLHYLSEYTDYHFSEEEELQKSVNYPGFEEHQKKHRELQKVVAELIEMLEEQEGPTDAFVNQLYKNVGEWLLYHIRGFDRSVAEYIFMRENENRI